ncbi:MAG: hypothetical protein MJ247_01120 [Alphaproteobacteria bacterium]|nr:hypothetical protein [Alphaproteobacteria bacterium]
MEENKLTAKQDTTDNKIVELKGENLKNVSAGDLIIMGPHYKPTLKVENLEFN